MCCGSSAVHVDDDHLKGNEWRLKPTVERMVMTLRTKVRRRYLARRGIVEDVGGRIFETSNRKTTMERRTEIVNVIFSAKKEAAEFQASII